MKHNHIRLTSGLDVHFLTIGEDFHARIVFSTLDLSLKAESWVTFYVFHPIHSFSFKF